jgi:hypothetical protein
MFMIYLDTKFNLPSFSGSLVFMIKGKAKWNTGLCVAPLQKKMWSQTYTRFLSKCLRTIFHGRTFGTANIAPALKGCVSVWCYVMIHKDNGWSLVAWYPY